MYRVLMGLINFVVVSALLSIRNTIWHSGMNYTKKKFTVTSVSPFLQHSVKIPYLYLDHVPLALFHIDCW